MRATIQEIADKKPHWILFLALAAFYLSFTPGTIKGMGYNQENLVAADQIATNLINLASGRPLAPLSWPRHGLLELLFELPFVFASKLLFGSSLDWIGRVMALQPILFTSLSCAVTFLWIQRLTKSPARSCFLSVAAGVATMLWPYVYIGLETTQSLFVILSAYLALAAEKRDSLPRDLIFGLCCATAISVKLNSVFMAPAILYLIYCYFFRDEAPVSQLRRRLPGIILVVAVVAVVYAVNRHYSSKFFSADPNASSGYYFSLMADSPLRMAFYFLSYFSSINKSLFLYAPITALGLFALPGAFRNQRRLAIFTVLTLAGMAGGFSLTFMWAEETWGPRYLHEAILPLTLCLAAAKMGLGFRWRREAPLLVAAVVGVVVSFLGSSFYYGNLHNAATMTSQNALELLQFDPRFNHIEFNARLLKLWAAKRFGGTDEPEYWPASYHWWFQKPPDAAPEKAVDLRAFAIPFPLALRGWSDLLPITPNQYRVLQRLLLGSLLFSLALFGWLAYLSSREPGRKSQESLKSRATP